MSCFIIKSIEKATGNGTGQRPVWKMHSINLVLFGRKPVIQLMICRYDYLSELYNVTFVNSVDYTCDLPLIHKCVFL
jgi:hypothetical protein